MKIGIDGRLIKQTGVGRYTKNLFFWLRKIDKRNSYILFQPKIQWHSWKEQCFFPFWLLVHNFDLIHFTYFSFPLFSPRKFIITIHDLIPWHFKTGRASTLPVLFYRLKHFFYKLLLFLGAKRACKIIAVSKATKEEIVENLRVRPEKVVVIYEGIDERIKNRNKELRIKNKFKKLPTTNYLLYVGNAYPHKNLERLIEAFIKFKIPAYGSGCFTRPTCPPRLTPSGVGRRVRPCSTPDPSAGKQNLKLVLVGPEDYFYQRLKGLVEKRDLQNEINFYGSASDEELFFLYKKALAFVSPSLMEGFGLPGLEAMSVGCPVICSNIKAFREIYGRAAIYFNAENTNDIKEKIAQFFSMDKEGKKRLIKAGREQVKRYSWEKCAKQTLKVYQECF